MQVQSASDVAGPLAKRLDGAPSVARLYLTPTGKTVKQPCNEFPFHGS